MRQSSRRNYRCPNNGSISKGGQQQGPVSSKQLKQMAATGQLQPTDLVWKEGMEQWVAASSIKGLFAATTSTPPPPPPPMPNLSNKLKPGLPPILYSWPVVAALMLFLFSFWAISRLDTSPMDTSDEDDLVSGLACPVWPEFY